MVELKAMGNSNSPKSYSYTDRNLNAGKYSFRLKMIDNDGTFKYSNEIQTAILLPKKFILNQNYPNPFNPNTTIEYSLPNSGNVKLTVYNAIGSKVATIINEFKPAGNYSAQFNGTCIPSGIYFYRLESGTFSTTKKFILLK